MATKVKISKKGWKTCTVCELKLRETNFRCYSYTPRKMGVVGEVEKRRVSVCKRCAKKKSDVKKEANIKVMNWKDGIKRSRSCSPVLIKMEG